MVSAYETSKSFTHLGDKILAADKRIELSEVRDWLKNLRDGDEHREMLDLAILIREISRRGTAEIEMCREILEAVLKYSDNRNETSFLSL